MLAVALLENWATESHRRRFFSSRFELNGTECRRPTRLHSTQDWLGLTRPDRSEMENQWIYDRRKLKWICLWCVCVLVAGVTWHRKWPNMKSINWLPDFYLRASFISEFLLFETIRFISSSISFVGLACMWCFGNALSGPFKCLALLSGCLDGIRRFLFFFFVFAAHFPLWPLVIRRKLNGENEHGLWAERAREIER